mgnify:CR=1 FL=1
MVNPSIVIKGGKLWGLRIMILYKVQFEAQITNEENKEEEYLDF